MYKDKDGNIWREYEHGWKVSPTGQPYKLSTIEERWGPLIVIEEK